MKTMDEAVRYALNNFTTLLKSGHTPESAGRFMVQKLTMSPALVAAAQAEHDRIARGIREFWEPRALADGTLIPEPWYAPGDDDVYWPALRSYLRAKPNWNGAPLEALDQGSAKVVSLIQPPWDNTINTRGLVIGYVQSGKTSNFTAVISKAADAGYRLFIVLAGVHNNLRRQTQLRLEEQLVNLNEVKWLPLTSEKQDFGNPVRATPLLAQDSFRLLAVVKKNSTRLQNLKSWLTLADKAGVLAKCPVLVIDDEADQAGINVYKPASDKAQQKRNKINELIVDILSFPKVAYIGYTATPFANFFIDPHFPQDLYPRHFICDLPRSDDYFGPESLFGREPKTADEPESEPLDMIRLVEDSELPQLVPPAKKGSSTFQPAVTESLRLAIRWFLLAATARRIREGEPRHTTMLIHTSHRVFAQDAMWGPVAKEVKSLKKSLASGDTTVAGELSKQWTGEAEKVDGAKWGHTVISAEEVVAGLPQTIALLGNLSNREAEDCGIVVDNGYAARRLVYDDENPLPVIVIGGNTLSRGLTLEGLVSSFFVRRGGSYDTLLQMGRWFGYRRDYEDLPRMWVTKGLKKQFRALATVEDQIRSEIARYAAEKVLPIQVPVKVMKTKGLAITALNKQHYVKSLKVSYSGQRPQTILFRPDTDWLRHNLDSTKELLQKCINEGRKLIDRGNRMVVKDIPASYILEYFDKDDGYQFHPANSELNQESLVGYIRSRLEKGELATWNLAVISRHEKEYGDIDLGFNRKLNLIGRSMLPDSSDSTTVNIGVLTNQVDWVADLDLDGVAGMSLGALRAERNKSERAVLLLYPIARDSRAKSKDKADLSLQEDVVGVSIAFPWAQTDSEEDEGYVVVQLPEIPTTEENEEEEDDDDEDSLLDGDDGEGTYGDDAEIS